MEEKISLCLLSISKHILLFQLSLRRLHNSIFSWLSVAAKNFWSLLRKWNLPTGNTNPRFDVHRCAMLHFLFFHFASYLLLVYLQLKKQGEQLSFNISSYPEILLLRWIFSLRNQKVSYEYGECCTLIILHFDKNLWPKNIKASFKISFSN